MASCSLPQLESDGELVPIASIRGHLCLHQITSDQVGYIVEIIWKECEGKKK